MSPPRRRRSNRSSGGGNGHVDVFAVGGLLLLLSDSNLQHNTMIIVNYYSNFNLYEEKHSTIRLNNNIAIEVESQLKTIDLEHVIQFRMCEAN